MAEPAMGGTAPIKVAVEKGESYWWCACGHSKNQPFCDGSHAGSGFEPKEWVAPRDREIFMCTCKRTKTGPFCDGAHNHLS